MRISETEAYWIGGPHNIDARTALPFAPGIDIDLDIGDGDGFHFRVTIAHVYQPCTVAVVLLVVFDEDPPVAWAKKKGERAILKLYDRRYAFGIRKAVMRGVGDEGLGAHDRSIESGYHTMATYYWPCYDLVPLIKKHRGVKPSGVKPRAEIKEPSIGDDGATSSGSLGGDLDQGEIYFDEWRCQHSQNLEYLEHRAKPYGRNEAHELDMKYSLATRIQALCLSLQRNEAAIYEKLHPLQAMEIPKFYTAVWMNSTDDGSLLESLKTGSDDFIYIPGILLEYVEGEYLGPMILGVDTIQGPRGASVSVPRDQADKELEKMIEASARVVNKVADHGVVNEELTDHNLLLRKKKDGGLFPVMFDFALARSRREDETDEEWNNHKWVEKRDGVIDYDALRKRDPTRRRKVENILGQWGGYEKLSQG